MQERLAENTSSAENDAVLNHPLPKVAEVAKAETAAPVTEPATPVVPVTPTPEPGLDVVTEQPAPTSSAENDAALSVPVEEIATPELPAPPAGQSPAALGGNEVSPSVEQLQATVYQMQNDIQRLHDYFAAIANETTAHELRVQQIRKAYYPND